MQQLANYHQRKCLNHENKDIIYLQTVLKKQKQLGVCVECITSNDLDGKNLILVSEIEDMINKKIEFFKKFPKLEDSNFLKNYQDEYSSSEYLDPQSNLKDFFLGLKNKIGNSIENIEKQIIQKAQENLVDKSQLLKTYDQILDKGKFLTFFKDFMLDDQDKGQNLLEFFQQLNQKQIENSKCLNDQLQAFKKTQKLIKQQQPIQQILIENSLNFIEVIGKSFIFDDNSDGIQSSIQSIQQGINVQLEAFNQILRHFGQIQQEQANKKNQIFFEFFSQNSQDISIDFIKFSKNILQSETEFKQNVKENIQQQKRFLFQDNLNELYKKIDHLAKEYCSQISNNFQQAQNVSTEISQSNKPVKVKAGILSLKCMLPIVNNTIKYPNQEKIFIFVHLQAIQNDQQYRVQLVLKPFQTKEGQYNFCIGLLKDLNQDENRAIKSESSYCLSNNNRMSTINAKALQGINISDQQIAHSEQMRSLEFLFCLKSNQFEICDLPKKENITVANDERLQTIDSNKNIQFYIQTQGIQEVNFVDFRILNPS
ncbi:hypothetical protein ABPG72_017565 [Tetrahymena utriculariae]